MPSNKTSTTFVCLSALALLCAAPAFAQGMNPNPAGNVGDAHSSAKASASDKKFVEKALQGGMAEVELGKLATEKASSSDVKDFGSKMVDDHTKLGDQMKPIAAQLGITPPSSLSTKDQALMTKLQGLSGSAFDKAYMDSMVADHKEDDKEFQAEETSGKDPQVRDAATQGEPIIAQHLQMAQEIQKKIKK